jgi:hypothetical protein
LVSPFSSQGIALSTPTLLGLAPAPSPPIATGNVPSQFEPRIASVTPPADRSGVVPQMPVPWAPDTGQLDSRRAVAANGIGERTLEFHVLKVVHQPLALAAIATAERAVVPDGMAVEKAPVLAPARGNTLGSEPEAPGPAATMTAALTAPEDKAEWPHPWKLGWSLLAVTGLSSLAYFKYRESFKPRWLSRSPRRGDAGNRPGLGEP